MAEAVGIPPAAAVCSRPGYIAQDGVAAVVVEEGSVGTGPREGNIDYRSCNRSFRISFPSTAEREHNG